MTALDHAWSILAVALAVAIIAVAWWRKAPIVMGLVLANLSVFIFTVVVGGSGLTSRGPLIEDLAARVSYLSVDEWPRLYTIFTATFLHADVIHLVGNMLVLLLVGVPFEERVKRGRFLAIYFWSAIVAVLLHALYIHWVGTAHDRVVPLVGASGAVFGILAAFATMWPRDRVYVVLPIFMFPIRMPIVIAAIVFMAIEFLALASGGLGRVAHAAHFGGAIGGVILGLLLRRPAARDEGGARRAIRYDVLGRLATTSQQRLWVEKARENDDHPEARKAWLDRLVPTLRCPDHDQAFVQRGRNRLYCPAGHEERYAD